MNATAHILFTDDLVRELFERANALGLIPEHEQPSEWLTAKDAAKYLSVELGTLHNLVSAGRLPRQGAKGQRLRFRREELDEYLETRGREAA